MGFNLFQIINSVSICNSCSSVWPIEQIVWFSLSSPQCSGDALGPRSTMVLETCSSTLHISHKLICLLLAKFTRLCAFLGFIIVGWNEYQRINVKHHGIPVDHIDIPTTSGSIDELLMFRFGATIICNYILGKTMHFCRFSEICWWHAFFTGDNELPAIFW